MFWDAFINAARKNYGQYPQTYATIFLVEAKSLDFSFRSDLNDLNIFDLRNT